MRIAIEAQRLFRKKKHGMDIVALELIRCLQQMDQVNEYFILVKPDEDDQIISETKNFHIIEIPAAPYPIWEQILLPIKLKKINPDILHCTGNTAPIYTNIPMVLTLHDILYMKKTTSNNLDERFENLYRKWIVPRIIPHCKQIITVSDFEKKEIIDYFHLPEDKVKTIHNAQSIQFKVITDIGKLIIYKANHNLPDHYILYLGNTHPNKNIKNVLIALKMLHQYEQTKIALVMPDIDENFLKNTLEEIDAPELYSAIHLTGYVPNHELVYLYNLATLFLYPSFYESFGIPILEAMACGTPVVASKNAAMPEVAGDAAEMINPDSPDEIAFAVQKLVCNESIYVKYKEEGVKRAELFNWKNTAQKVLDIYDQINLQTQSFNPATKAI